MIFLFIFSVIVRSVAGATPTCPAGFSILKDDTCVKLIDTPLFYQDALEYCKAYPGGNLVSIHNAIDNRALVTIANDQGYTKPVWLGMTCMDWEYVTCVWEDQTGYSTSYSSFASGYPSLDIGVNSYMITTGNSIGKWVSADGTVQTLSFFCEVPTNGAKMFCPNEVNSYCYTFTAPSPFLSFQQARDYCTSQCGDLASLHSDYENFFIKNLVPYTFYQKNQFWIGAQTDGNALYWTDNSQFDYNNFGFLNPDIGNCSSLSIYTDTVTSGQWISSSCDQKLPFVCKRPKNVTTCTGVSPTVIPNGVPLPTVGPRPTVSPNDPEQCHKGAQFFSGSGTIYSPFYPNNYNSLDGGPCTYVITVPHGKIAQVQFTQDTFIKNSWIEFYPQLEDGKQFGNFSGNAPEVPFYSSTNVIKMVFHLFWEYRDVNEHWVANFGVKV
ncbi:unnamed protein product [Caenorhabditis brenneri]